MNVAVTYSSEHRAIVTSRATTSKHGDTAPDVSPLRLCHVHSVRGSRKARAISRWPRWIIGSLYRRELKIIDPSAVVPRSCKKYFGIEGMRDDAGDCL